MNQSPPPPLPFPTGFKLYLGTETNYKKLSDCLSLISLHRERRVQNYVLIDSLSVKISNDGEADDDEDDEGDLITGSDQSREHQRIGGRSENVSVNL